VTSWGHAFGAALEPGTGAKLRLIDFAENTSHWEPGQSLTARGLLGQWLGPSLETRPSFFCSATTTETTGASAHV